MAAAFLVGWLVVEGVLPLVHFVLIIEALRLC